MTTPRVNVDELIKQTSPHQVAGHLGIALPPKTSGELRIDCLFCEERSSTYGNLVVNLDKPHNPIYAHCCGVRGNLLMLMYGMVHGRPPSGGKLQGEDFNEMKQLLIEVNQPGSTGVVRRSNEKEIPKVEEEPPYINLQMKHAEKEAARDLANLYEDFITDPQAMKPAAGQYVRQRPWLTPEVMERWRIGWIPGDGRSMFRRDFLVYTQLDEQGDVLSYSGRDLHFDEKQKRWEEADRPADKKPAKHRFVKGYHRGLELYGQHRQRLTPALRESLRRYGLSRPNTKESLQILVATRMSRCWPMRMTNRGRSAWDGTGHFINSVYARSLTRTRNRDSTFQNAFWKVAEKMSDFQREAASRNTRTWRCWNTYKNACWRAMRGATIHVRRFLSTRRWVL